MKKVLWLIIFIALVSLVELKKGWRKNNYKSHWSKHRWQNNKPDKEEGSGNIEREVDKNKEPSEEKEYDIFKYLADKVIANDKRTLTQCQQYTLNEATEVYGTYNYKLIIPLKDIDPEYITVVIKHRVTFINAVMPDIDQRFQSDENSFYDIRILPNFLNTKKARWFVKNGKLEIVIPYKFTFNKEARKTCEADFHVEDQERKVPKGDEEIGIDKDIMDQIFGKKTNAIPNRMMDDETTTTSVITTTTTPTTPTINITADYSDRVVFVD